MEYEKRINVFKDTPDDWQGSFKLDSPDQRHPSGKLVHVSYIPLAKKTGHPDIYRVCAWGNDDFGLELDLEDKVEAMRIFMSIITQENVTKKQLLQHGFRNA